MKLRGFEKRWLAAIGLTMLPPDTGAGPDARTLEAFADDVMRVAPTETRLGLRLAVWIVTLGALVWRCRLRPFHRLAADDRPRYLDALAASRFYALRELPSLLKLFACLAWEGLPDVQRAVGYPQPASRPPSWVPPEAT